MVPQGKWFSCLTPKPAEQRFRLPNVKYFCVLEENIDSRPVEAIFHLLALLYVEHFARPELNVSSRQTHSVSGHLPTSFHHFRIV